MDTIENEVWQRIRLDNERIKIMRSLKSLVEDYRWLMEWFRELARRDQSQLSRIARSMLKILEEGV